AVGGGLDDLEVGGHETRAPVAALTHRPDHPDLLGAPVDSFLKVGVGDVDRVDVGAAVDPYGREPHRQRDACGEEVLGHPCGRQNLELLPAEVYKVKGGGDWGAP